MNQQREEITLNLSFDNNSLLPMLFGEYDKNLTKLEKALHIAAISRGNVVALKGYEASVNAAANVLNYLYQRLEKGHVMESGDIDASIRFAREKFAIGGSGNHGKNHHRNQHITDASVVIKTPKKHINPHTSAQAEYMHKLFDREMVFAVGPAGTGKTYIAVAMAVAMFVSHKVERIVLCRPAVEAGEKLGFLPGDLKDKIDPYLRPLYDALYDMLPADKVMKCMETGEIEIAPLAFMRGRTLANSFIILDEAQNCTPMQMKMFLTRIGENSRMVIAGDLTQVDLPTTITSGLKDAIRKLASIEDIGFAYFDEHDVIRHHLAAKVVGAYERAERKKQSGKNEEFNI